MRIFKLSSLHIAALVLISVLTASLLTYTWVGAVTGEITIDETSILLTDGTNPMVADLDAGTYDVYNSTWSNSTNTYATNSYTTGDVYYGSDNRTDILANPQEAWSYLIYVDPDNSSLYHAKASNGTVCWSSTNVTALWENVRDNGLTSGRTTKETVTFKGTFYLSIPLIFTSLDKYTILDLYDAKIILVNSANCNIIYLQSNADYIDILGGELDGNDGQQTSGNGIYVSSNNNDVFIKDITIHDVKNYPIRIYANCLDVFVDHVNIYNSGNILIQGDNCILQNSVITDITGNSAIEINPTGADYGEIRILNNHIETSASSGKKLITVTMPNGNGYEICDNTLIATGALDYGIYVNSADDGIISRNTLTFATITGNGITHIGVGNNTLVSNNQLFNCSINFENQLGFCEVISITGNNIRNGRINLLGSSSSATMQWVGFTISNNIIKGNGVSNSMGINIAAKNGTVSGNVISDIIAGSYAGINLYGNANASCQNVLVSSNRVLNCEYGIREQESANNTVIIGCDARGCTYGITTVGVGTKVNLCWNATTWIDSYP